MKNVIWYLGFLSLLNVLYVYNSFIKDIAAFRWAFVLVFSGCIIICVLFFFYYDLEIGETWKRRW